MNEKFINCNCAQMAAVAMWLWLSALKLHCNLKYGGGDSYIIVDVFLDEKKDIDLPPRYLYTSKVVRDFKATKKSSAFRGIEFTFEY